MKKPVSNRPKAPSQRRELIYSILIMVAIPVLIIGNTLWLSSSVRDNYEFEFSQRADIASKSFSAGVALSLDKETELQNQIDQLTLDEQGEPNPEILTLAVVTLDETNELQTIATNSVDDFNDATTLTQANTAEQKKRTVIYKYTNPEGSDIWRSVSPVINNGEVVAFTIIDLSSATSDALIFNILSRSLYIMLASVLVIMIMLFNHFRFVEYAMLYRKLEEVDQLKSDFLSVATHELKSPMTVIRGTVENILEGIGGEIDETAAENLRVVEKESARLYHLVADLLNVSRIEEGRISYEIEAVSLNNVIADVVSNYTDKAQNKNLKLNYNSETEYVVDVDRGRLTEIFTNLIDNALKYSQSGEVQISHEVDKDTVRTAVKDTGIGMSAKEREHLFERFYRVRNDKTQTISGTGLGLWIIKQYIEAMGGKIYVDSIEGQGSVFTVEFRLSNSK